MQTAAGVLTPRAGAPAAFVLFAAALLSGCGYVAEPLPPLANIPARITDLAAVQRGSTLIVQFAVPQVTTEGMPIKHGPVLDLRVGPASSAVPESEFAAHARQFEPALVEAGRALYEIPAAEWTGKDIVVAARALGSNRKN